MNKNAAAPQSTRTSVVLFPNTAGQEQQQQRKQQQGVEDPTSVYERMLESSAMQGSNTNTHAGPVPSGEEEANTMAHRLRDPVVSLAVLEQMRLVFDLYEWRQQRQRVGGVSVDSGNTHGEGGDGDMAAMLRWKQQQEEQQQKLQRLLRAERGDGGFPSRMTAYAGDDVSPGIPFAVFEAEIVQPFFDALFPLERPTQRNTSAILEDLHGDINSSLPTVGSAMRQASGKSMASAYTSYQRRRSSHVEAAENLFCVMDTNGDGFLSWDELSTYILQSGQRLLLSAEYGNDTGGRVAQSEGRQMVGSKKNDAMADYASRTLRFTSTPANSTRWQQQCPLVRYLYHTEPISQLIFANRGRRYITAAWDGLVKLWRPDPRLADFHGRPAIVHERTIFAAGAPIIDMVLAPESLGDAEVLVIAAMDGTVTLLRLGTGEILKTFLGRCLESDIPGTRSFAAATNGNLRWGMEGTGGSVAVDNDISNSPEAATVVMRPQFKVRAYHREAIEMFFTDASRYFIGLDVVAPTYEHLEQRRLVKANILLGFGSEPGALGDWNCSDSRKRKGGGTRRDVCAAIVLPSSSSSSSSAPSPPANGKDIAGCNKYKKEEEEDGEGGKKEKVTKTSDDAEDEDDEIEEDNRNNDSNNNNGNINGTSNNTTNKGDGNTNSNGDDTGTKRCTDGGDTVDDRDKEKRRLRRKAEDRWTNSAPYGAARHQRSKNTGGEKSWFARSVAVAKYEKTNSSSLLPSGALLFLGFDTGVLQIYSIQQKWFATSNLSLTRVEPPGTHEPVLTLTLHRAAITRIIASESHDLLMTASDDGTVVVRHISRIQAPFVTLGDCIPLFSVSATASLHSSGHTKRITSMCWNATRSLIVTSGADRFVMFWMASSSRPLFRVDLRTFSSSSAVSGFPVDVSFLQPPRCPLLVLVLDSKRTMYFFDCVSFQCLHMMCDDSPQSLRTGELLRARYDAVDDRLILGGRYVRLWDSQHTDKYPEDYRGHRRPVVALDFQQIWRFFVSADDGAVILWNVGIVDTLAKRSDSSKTSFNLTESKTSNSDIKDPSEKSANVKGEEGDTIQYQRPVERRSTVKMVNSGSRWALTTSITRSWRVEGGICSLTLEQAESSHLFVALLRERRIVEYNSFNGSPLRLFDFPTGMEEVVSVSCSAMGTGGSFLHPISFLCGSFEREQSPNGTTALYTLSIEGAAMLGAGSSSSEHRQIVTSDVGVSCSTIVSTLGIVVIGHRGGISVTPLDEATTCPIPCIRLTDRPAKKKVEKGKGTRKVEVTTTSECSRQSTVPEGGSSANTIVSSSSSGGGSISRRRRSMGMPESRHLQGSHSRTSPPLDLVALFPGPLIQDPVAITRECMQQRERYLFYTDPPPTNVFTRPSTTENPADEVSEGVSTREGVNTERRGLKNSSKTDELPPLLLFSEEFIASSSAFSGSFGVFLGEQLSTLGFVGQVAPIGRDTDYLVSGSDDGLLQVWNLRNMSEVMRCRVTYTIEAVTALEVNQDATHIAVGDANGYVLLLDVRNIDWTSTVPLETCTDVEKGVQLLQRWRGHRQSVTSVKFVHASQTVGYHDASSELAAHGSSHVVVPPFTRTSTTLPDDSGRSESKKTKSNSIRMSDTTTSDSIFLCTSSEDSYIYVWSWQPDADFGGYADCIGCFGGGSGGLEKVTKPPLEKLTDSAYKVMDVVRKAYIMEGLLCPGGVLSLANTPSAIQNAINVIIEDISAVKSGIPLSRRTTTTVSVIQERGMAPQRPSLVCENNRSRTYSFKAGLLRRSVVNGNTSGSSEKNFGGGIFHPSYVLAFERGCYYEHRLIDLLERLLTELKSTEKGKPVSSSVGLKPGELQGAEDSRGSILLPQPPITSILVDKSVSRAFSGVGGTAVNPSASTTATNANLCVSEDKEVSGKSTKVFPTPPPAAAVISPAEEALPPPWLSQSPHMVDTVQLPHSAHTAFTQQEQNEIQLQQQQEEGRLMSSPPATSMPVISVNVQAGMFAEPTTAAATAEWVCLPSVTVPYATSMPLPRQRHHGGLRNGKRAHRSSVLEGLPLLSQVIGLSSGNDGRQNHGVKVLLKEKKARRPYYTIFLQQSRKHSEESKIPSDPHAKIPAQKGNYRRQRKTKSALWGPERVMGTLMNWNAPRVPSALRRKSHPTATVTPPFPGTVAVAGSGRLYSGTASVSLKSSESEKPLFPLPLFIPTTLGGCCSQVISSSHELSKGRSVVLLLQEEMEAMKETLKTALHEKQLLLAQERMASQSIGGTTGSSATGAG